MKWNFCTIFFLLFAAGYFLIGCSASHHNQFAKNKHHQNIPALPPGTSLQAYTDSLFMSAEAAKQTGDIKKAVTDFTAYLHYKPDNATIYYELSKIFTHLQNNSFALHYAEKAVQLEPDNKWFEINYADLLAAAKKYDIAAGVYAMLHNRFPNNNEYVYNEGVLLINAAHYNEALKLFDSLENKNGISEEIIFQKQRLYLKQNNINAAAAEIQKLIDNDPDESRYYGLLAEVYNTHNMPDKAMQTYQALLQKQPGNPQALIALALHYKRQGDDAQYQKYMERAFTNPALDIDDKINFVYPFLKYVEIDSTKKDEALMLCRMIVKAHPDDARAYSLYGDMLFQCGYADSALYQYRHSAGLDSSNADVWQQVMRIYSAEQKNDSLLAVSKVVMRLFPDNFLGYYFNGAVNVFLRNEDTAIITLNEALSYGVQDVSIKSEIYSLLGEAYNAVHEYAASDSSFDNSLVLVPNNDLVLNNYSYYLSERGEQLEKAERMSKISLELSPDNYVYEDTYAWVLFKLGKYNDAKTWMEKALSHQQAKNGPGYLEHYGDILYKLNDVDGAVKYWELAKSKGANSPLLDKKILERKIVRAPSVLQQ